MPTQTTSATAAAPVFTTCEPDEPTETIKEELLQQLGEGSVLSVERFHRRNEAGHDRRQPLSTVRVTVNKRAAYDKLLSKDFRLYGLLQVRRTALGEQAPLPHCSRCLQWGHRATNCLSTADRIVRCYRCGSGGHLAASCSAQISTTPKCHNCGGEHATRYRGCPAYKKAIIETVSPAFSALPLQHHSQTARMPLDSVTERVPEAPECATRNQPKNTTTRRRRAATNPREGFTYDESASTITVAPSGDTDLLRSRATRSISASSIPRPINPIGRLGLIPRPPSKPVNLRRITTIGNEEAYQSLERALHALLPPSEANLISQVVRLLISARTPSALQ